MYQSLSYKTKQLFFTAIKLSIVIGCVYFIYKKLANNNQLHFSDFYQNLIKNDVFSAKNIVLLSIFTIFNWFFEILKWSKLASFVRKTTFLEAIKQSLASLTTSLITPNRIGEYGTKALYFEKKQRKKIMGLNLVGNFYQLLITLFFGLIGFGFFYLQHNVHISFRRFYKIFIVGFFLVFSFFYSVKQFKYRGYFVQKARAYINKIPKPLHVKIAVYSLFRYLIFSHQFYYLVLIFNIDILYIDAMSAITSVYLIASIVPMLSVFDVVLKGTVAVWVFLFFQIEELTVLSITTIMWIFNFVFPAIIGTYFVIIFKTTFAK